MSDIKQLWDFVFSLSRPFVKHSGPRIFLSYYHCMKAQCDPGSQLGKVSVYLYRFTHVRGYAGETVNESKTDLCKLKLIWGHSYFPELNTTGNMT